MKKLMLFITLLLLVAGGIFLFLTSDALNILIKEKIEQVGTEYSDQRVTVKSVEMKLFDGKGTIKGVVLNNPKQYSRTPAFSLDEITLNIDINSLTGDPIVIDEIIIDKPSALVEFNQSGKTNIQEILDAINKKLPQGGAKSTSQPTQTTGKAESRITVKKFILAGVALEVDLTALGNKKHKKSLPDIKLSHIGGNAGLPASELGAELMKKALTSIWQVAQKEQRKIVEDKVKEKVQNKVNDLFNKYSKDGE